MGAALGILLAGSAIALALHDWWEVRRIDESALTVRDSRNRFLLSQGVFLGVLMVFGIIGTEVAVALGGCL
jgi:hypothetical protein